MTVAIQTKSVQEIFEDMTESYSLGDYIDGRTSYGEDALMSPDKFADRFQTHLFLALDTGRPRSYHRN